MKFNLFLEEHRDLHAGIKEKRSSHWHKVRDDFLKENSTCAICGTTEKLNVHHKKPFHLFPELELEPTNLITLCMEKECHLLIGHGDNFRDYNPNVEEDVAKLKQNINLFEEVAVEAKKNRLVG